jgi:hypothetical protein
LCFFLPLVVWSEEVWLLLDPMVLPLSPDWLPMVLPLWPELEPMLPD